MNNLERELAEIEKRSAELKRFVAKYPHLNCINTRWDKVFVTDHLVPTHYSIRHSCGCCDDAAASVGFYVEDEGQQIWLKNPDLYGIGYKNDYTPLTADRHPCIPETLWEEAKQSVLRKIQSQEVENNADQSDDE